MLNRPAVHLLLLIAAVALITACGTTTPPDQGNTGYAERMAREHANDAPVEGAAAMKTGDATAQVTTREVTYATIDGAPIKGYLAEPAEPSDAALIVIHEWWGLNDNIRVMTEKLAGLGYTALAVDMYGGRVAATPDEARALMTETMKAPDQGQENIRQAHAWLTDEGGAARVGSIGWCFGGGWSLQTALMGRSEATVIYYGRLVTEQDKLKDLNAPILGIFGSEDKGIPVDSVKAFEASLKALNKPHTIQIYEGANHAFANPSGTRYDAEAARDAWARTEAFLEEHLKR
ncbi:MAG: carboxymethylenebutenolidase [Myxococcales bacterium]|nr:carboxymethylenebutenolidase [Myxococcales bacterium]